MLNIRRFVQGKDEGVWSSVWNKAFTDFGDFRSMSIEDMLMKEKNPNFDAAGMFIAELNGEPVGIVNARVDKQREEKKGFIRFLGAVPEHRGKGIGRALAEKAVESLQERGMQVVETTALTDKPAAVRLWESMGFERVRVFSLMKASLKSIPCDVGENREAQLRRFESDSLEDLKLLTWLTNETFKEHYNFRPNTVDEVRYFLEQDPQFKDQENLFALVEDEPIGYVVTAIDRKYNAERNARCGWIVSIGVLKQNRLKGVGKKLMIEGMKLLKAKGMADALLGVDDQNPTNAIRLYEKMGFEAIEKEIAYRKTIR